MQELLSFGWSPEQYAVAVRTFREAGLTIGYSVRRRSWFSQRIGGTKPGECIVAIDWMPVERFVGMLDEGPAPELAEADAIILESAGQP